MAQDDKWSPPSTALREEDGIWSPIAISDISYPDDGNETCFQVEDTSYWFAHRNRCILELVEQFRPAGTIFDIGGGNGFVSKGLQENGWQVALVEPGSGAKNAKKRGVERVVCATLADAEFDTGVLPAACAFDVIEHIEDDAGFLDEIFQLLEPGGMLYLTVPAYDCLWSQEDIKAGHFRRYDMKKLRQVLGATGFETLHTSALFGWLVGPLFAIRSLPYRIAGRSQKSAEALLDMDSSHRLPAGVEWLVERIHRRERLGLRKGKVRRIGTSLICAAQKPR